MVLGFFTFLLQFANSSAFDAVIIISHFTYCARYHYITCSTPVIGPLFILLDYTIRSHSVVIDHPSTVSHCYCDIC